MKKTIKINFKDFWEAFNPEDNLFINLLKKNYDVIISSEPDFVFYSVYPEKNEVKDSSKYGEKLRFLPPFIYEIGKRGYYKFVETYSSEKINHPQGDFVKIFYTPENIKPDMDKCDWAFSFNYDEEFNHPRHLRLPNYKFEELKGSLIKKGTNFDKIKKEKNKFCNFIYAQDIQYRNKFFEKLNEYKKIDSSGRCMNNMSPVGNHKDARQSRKQGNWAEEKVEFMKPYKFTIAFENTSNLGYTTEKIYHAMLTNSIPIYFGNPLVLRDFNPKSFINCNDFKTFDEVVKKVIEIDQDDELYYEILKQPWFNDNKPSIYFDDKRISKRLKEIFG